MNPMHFLTLEWRKYSPSGTFRVIAALYFISFALILFLARQLSQNMTIDVNGAATLAPLSGIFTYPHNWELLANIGSWMNMFLLGFLGVLIITIEFSNRTLRQSVIFGMTRLELAVSKLVWALALALAATGFYLLLGFIEEILDRAGLGLPPVGSVLGFFAQALGYLLLGNLVGLLIRKTPLAELAYLAYVAFLEPVGRWIFYYTVARTPLLLYLPNTVFGALTPRPVLELEKQIRQSIVESGAATAPLSHSEVGLAALAYLLLFGALFCRRIVKSDL